MQLPKDLLKTINSGLWLVDTLVGVFCIAAAVDIGFAPGRTSTFESGTLALVIIFLSSLVILAALAPGFLIHTWVRALERFLGKGVLYILMGILVSSPTVIWRVVPAGFTVFIGFCYLLLSVFQRQMHPRPLLSAGTEDEAAAAAAATAAAAARAPAAAAAGGSGAAPAALFVRAAEAHEGAGAAQPAPKRSHNPFLNPPEP